MLQTPTSLAPSRQSLYDSLREQIIGNLSSSGTAVSSQAFAARRLFVLTKAQQLAPLHYNKAQADLMANLMGRDLVLKARQLGISTAVQGMLYQEAVTSTASTMTLARDDDGTAILRLISDRFYQNDPQKPKQGTANARRYSYPEHDSHALIATAGNKTSGRSTTLSHLHGSETAFWPDPESIVAGAMQAGNPRVILESTPNGAQGYFYQLCMEALEGDTEWTLHFYPWWIDEAYQLPLDHAAGETLAYSVEEEQLVEQHKLSVEQIKWRRVKQRELKHLFLQEYPEDARSCFLRSGLGYFGDLTGVFEAPVNALPDSAHEYVAGLDFAQTIDFTDMAVIDATANVQVDLLHINRLSWAEMRKRVADKCQHWHITKLLAETNAMGSTNIEALTSELSARGSGTKLMPFTTSNESKASIMSTLYSALHEGGLKLLPDPVQRHELGAFIARQASTGGVWRLAAPDGEHDDTVIGLALANYARYRTAVRTGVW